MSEGIVIGDVHASLKHIKTIKESFDFLFSTSEYKSSDFIIFQGDLFDHRKNIDIMVLDTIMEIFQKMSDKKVYIIMGNHDMYNRESNNISSLNVLEKVFKNTKVVKEPLLENISGVNIYMIPFNKVPYKKEIKKADYILGHIEIYPYFPKSEIKESLFSGKRVFMGHQHKFDPYDTPYSGSLFTTNYSEIDNQKHFLYIKDRENYEFLKNEADVLHLSMKYENGKIIIPFLGEEYNLIELRKGFINEKYKYILEGTEEEIEKVFKFLSEANINLHIKTVVNDDREDSKEINKIDENEINELLKKKNNIFEVFRREIEQDSIKKKLFEEIYSIEYEEIYSIE